MTERWPRPLLIGATGEGRLLQPGAPGVSPFSEAELQGILVRYPQLLPVTQFDPLFSPPVCIGREVPTGVGPLDLLYVSPSGYLTLVETKLWKSPEARRQVVAQIIDYTRQIVRWDFSQLDTAFGQYARQAGIEQRGLAAYVADQCDENLDEMAFTDSVGRCLRHGRLLLLIVGDGIRENVEEMAAYLQDAPNLQFTLGLVEIGCYGLDAGSGAPSKLLVPRVVMRTAEVTRAIVQIEMSDEAARQVMVTTTTPPAEGVKNRTTLSKTEFYQLLQQSVGTEAANQTRMAVDRLVLAHEALQEDFTTKKLSIRADLPTSDLSCPVLYISTAGAVTVYRWLWQKASERGIPADVVERFVKGLHEIDAKFPSGVTPDGQIPAFKTPERNASLANVLPRFAEVERLLVELLQDVDRKAQQAV